MNITVPVSWLREYLKTDASAKKIAEFLSLHGQSVEKIAKIGADHLFDVEITSNRSDAASIYGLAREANAILNFNRQKSSLVDPQGINTSLQPDVKDKLSLEVSLSDSSLCPRFTAIIIDNVKIKPSPAIIKNRLEACNFHSINNIVDISNYIMLLLGQPMHAFDFDKIKGAKMYLRESEKGESIKTLDDQNRKLPQGSIVISDAERLIDLCGIMGGFNSEITTRTKRVLLFAQVYDPIRIRKTTQALAFRTEAAARFEKGIDIESIPQALSAAVYLAKLNAGAKIASELIDIYKNPLKSKTITLHKPLLDDYLGINLSMEKAAQILKFLGFTVQDEAESLSAQAPSWRHEDMEQAEDLIEEIARIYGYHNLPSILTSGSQPAQSTPSDLSLVIGLKNALKYLGLTETISYSIISEDFLKLTGVKNENAVELANPLSSEWQFMRPTILVSLASIIAQNQNMRNNLKLFEIAKTYVPSLSSSSSLTSTTSLSSSRHPKDGPPLGGKRGSSDSHLRENDKNNDLPTQDLHLSIVLQNSDFYQIKGLVENVFEILGREAEFKKLETYSSSESSETRRVEKSNPNQSLFQTQERTAITSGGKPVGTLGILGKNIQNHFAIDGPTAIAEINLSIVYSLSAIDKNYRPIPKFPPVIEDISAIFDSQITVAEIIKTVKTAGFPLLKQIEIMDIYRDEKIGIDKKSVTLHLTYQKPSSTPTQEEVNLVREKIISSVEKNLNGQVRK